MVIFISNFVSPHTIPFSEELYNILGENFLFIETRQMTAERSSLGYDKLRSKPFVVSYKRFNLEKKKYQDLIGAADTVLASYGSIDTALLEGRIANDKQTFLLSERLFKKGILKLADPKLWKTVLFINRIKKKNFHLLCMGAYVAKDFARVGFPKEKMWKFGYITLPSQRPIEHILHSKCVLPTKILWVGRFIWWKQPLVALKACYRLVTEGHDILLNVVGDGKMRNKVTEYLAKHDSHSRISYSGLQDNAIVRQIMEESHILLCTSNKLEGWGAVINEGMNAGCVVIANKKMGAAPYLIEHGKNGYLYDGTETALYETIKEAISNPLIAEVAKAAYQSMANVWNPKDCASRFVIFKDDCYNNRFESGPFSKA